MRALSERARDVVQEIPSGYGGGIKLTAGPLGGVTVTSWKKRIVRVEAHISVAASSEQDFEQLFGIVGPIVTPSPTTIEVETSGPHDEKWLKGIKNFPKTLKKMPFRVDYTLTVPEYTALDLAVFNGETAIDGVSGIVSVISTNGPIHVKNCSGPIVLTATGGSIDIATREKSLHGGSIRATAADDVSMTVPHGFSCYLDASAPHGILMSGENQSELGNQFRGDIGNGGGGVGLAAGGRIILAVGVPPSNSPAEEPQPPGAP
jgi:hypothetical protein